MGQSVGLCSSAMPIQLTTQKKLQREDAVKVEDLEHAEDFDVEYAAQGANESSKQSKSEKKSHKALLKLGMKPITGVSRVTFNRTKNIIFGEANIEDLSSWLQTQAAQQFRMPDFASVIAKSDISAPVARAQGDEEDKDSDETGVEPHDIDLVMTQAGVSKGKAVKALETCSGDRVSAIMAHNIDKLYDLP
ncbi:hypothetical protein RHMOL_Rhmol09G0271800 [Rhododendron molle]|uniref:Uncharacterized protein n=1 Tax=Rhododendron molle TaxID=49168 RepID=A0ACC0MHM4_RHOML|nr:hypothetical protein RHMOL_Rhmol09G0271800 [Rhododendron molle]